MCEPSTSSLTQSFVEGVLQQLVRFLQGAAILTTSSVSSVWGSPTQAQAALPVHWVLRQGPKYLMVILFCCNSREVECTWTKLKSKRLQQHFIYSKTTADWCFRPFEGPFLRFTRNREHLPFIQKQHSRKMLTVASAQHERVFINRFSQSWIQWSVCILLKEKDLKHIVFRTALLS